MGERVFEKRMYHSEIEEIIRNHIEEFFGYEVVDIDLFVEEDNNDIGAVVKFRQQGAVE